MMLQICPGVWHLSSGQSRGHVKLTGTRGSARVLVNWGHIKVWQSPVRRSDGVSPKLTLTPFTDNYQIHSFLANAPRYVICLFPPKHRGPPSGGQQPEDTPPLLLLPTFARAGPVLKFEVCAPCEQVTRGPREKGTAIHSCFGG